MYVANKFIAVNSEKIQRRNMKNNTDSAQTSENFDRDDNANDIEKYGEKEKRKTTSVNEFSVGNSADVATNSSLAEQSLAEKEPDEDVKIYKKNAFDEKQKINVSQQSRELNAEFARRRREKELKDMIEQAKVSAVIDALDGKNPYTNEKIKTFDDVEKYLQMKKNVQNQGSADETFPNQDSNPKTANYTKNSLNTIYDSSNNQEINTNNAKLNNNEQTSSLIIDMLSNAETQKREYLINHSEEEYLALVRDLDFQDFVSDKAKLTLEEKQVQFNKFKQKLELRARILASQILANKLSSPGALRSEEKIEPSYLSRKQVEEMSSKEIHENYDKIKQSMKHWK